MKKLLLLMVLTLAIAWPRPTEGQVASVKDISVGGGSFFADEDQTFDTDALFVAAHWDGLQLPMEANSGVGVEVRFPSDSQAVRYALWSLNRLPVAKGIYTGADLKISQGNENDVRFNFDARIVLGASLGAIRGHDLVLEIYSLEENRPIAFLFKVGL